MISVAFAGILTHADIVPQHSGPGFRDWKVNPGAHFTVGFSNLPPEITGITFTNLLSDAHAAESQIRLNGSGVTAGDVDGDGWCDLYFCGLDGNNRLYRNLGSWRFGDITDAAGVACPNQFSTGAVFADVDGDGDLDLLVNSIGGGTRLFMNGGRGDFTEDTRTGLVRKYGSTSMALADMNGDGLLDLYVANYRTTTIRSTGFSVLNLNGRRSIRPEDREDLEYTKDGMVLENGEPDILYLNQGKGNFIPVSWTGGSFLDEAGVPLTQTPRDWGLSAMFRDLNGDSFPDLYVCNDFHSPDRIWLNDGKAHFRAIGRTALRNTGTFSMSVDVADVNRDGYDDIFVADMLDPGHRSRMAHSSGFMSALGDFESITNRPQLNRNTLQLGRGDGTYAEVAYYSGLEASGWTWGTLFLDVDLDGYEDLLATAGHLFDTQDLDANARIAANGPYRKERIPQKLLMYPRLPLAKALFRNVGGVRFEEVGKSWGFGDVGISQGMCLADLDNDGDLDVVVNSLNGVAGIYRNEGVAPRVAVRLRGEPPNTRGIGAKIRVLGGAVAQQSQEMMCGGRYLSGDESLRVFAAGDLTHRLRIEVDWRSGKRSVVEGAEANRVYEIAESGAAMPAPSPPSAPSASLALFADVSGLVSHTHHEDAFEDYERQPLLPRRMSQLGPGVGWLDLDGDGWEDLVIGSGRGGNLAAYQNDGRGGFQQLEGMPFAQVAARDLAGIVGWRRTDGARVVLAGLANYEDGVAAGSCVRQYEVVSRRVEDTLPGSSASSGPLALGDVAGDGNLALFVGGRVVGGRYPEAALSRLFAQRAEQWILDEVNTATLGPTGLVSGAVWTDLDGDGWPELVLACEWGPVKIFQNQQGRLRESTRDWGLDGYLGWWNGVSAGDFDGDGRMDLVASNWGLNSQYRASRKFPRRLYHGDLAGRGPVGMIEAYFEPELAKWVPERDRDALAKEDPWVPEKFPLHRNYVQASVEEILGERLTAAALLEANWLATRVFLNRGDHFEPGQLPPEAQFSPAFGINVADFDGDGHDDIFLSQNFFAVSPATSRSDAGRGLLLQGDGQGRFAAVPGQASGVLVYGEQRGSAVGDYDGDGRTDLAVSQNGAPTKLYHNVGGKPGLRVRLRGPVGNPEGIGAVVRLGFESRRLGAAREVHAGSGYWSQDSVVLVMATPTAPVLIQVRWPGSKTPTITDLPSDVREVCLDVQGRLLQSR
ncbi:MAG: hypothetical protein EXS36_06405 [Pedosphaera sp.]|nr:hypothetical protein [Pedosphaera sp.]